MAHIFKHPSSDGTKGIVVFTHKEWGHFTGNKIMKRLKREGKLPSNMFKELRSPYSKAIEGLKAHYFIGVHFGAYYPHYFQSKIVDFVLSKDSNLPNLDESVYRIPLNSRDFTPADFKRSSTKKSYDVMTVAQNVKVKNYPLLFKSIKSALAERPEMTFLLVTPSQASVSFGVEKNLSSLFYSTFSRAEQAQIAFLFLHPELQWGLDQKQLIEFYNRSKVFTLFSKQEGESRVISEALCCGLPVVAYKGLLGGGTDLLDETNSVLFDTFDSAHNAWIDAVDNFPDGVKGQPEKLTREDFTLARTEKLFKEFYQHKGAKYDGKLVNIDQLHRRLPGHHYDVAWMLKDKPTADVLSKSQFNTFLKHTRAS